MASLEDLKLNVQVKGIIPGQTVTVISARWRGGSAVELTYKCLDGQPGTQLLFRSDEPQLEITTGRRTWQFNTDGQTFRLAAEAYRIHLAHLFDPVLVVHTLLIESLPHQITAVYSEMLTRQPLRFLLADDPGAGKTIMAGLLIKELVQAIHDLEKEPVQCQKFVELLPQTRALAKSERSMRGPDFTLEQLQE
jgi:hypothetical protein